MKGTANRGIPVPFIVLQRALMTIVVVKEVKETHLDHRNKLDTIPLAYLQKDDPTHQGTPDHHPIDIHSLHHLHTGAMGKDRDIGTNHPQGKKELNHAGTPHQIWITHQVHPLHVGYQVLTI